MATLGLSQSWARARTAVVLLLLVHGCTSTPRPAPVSERAPSTAQPAALRAAKTAVREPDSRPEYYTVKRGDTLYTIALDHGLDYKELIEWNRIENPNLIRLGQELRLRAPPGPTVVAAPLRTPPAVSGKPVIGMTPPAGVAAGEAVKSEPKAIKVPYSDQAYAQMSGQQGKSVPPPVVKVEPRPDEKSVAGDDDDEKIDWGWPAGGKLLSTFNETTNLKGVGIAGKTGQPVVASAPGKVLYSGDGIRGYGKLVIIKHSKVFLSVYAHNSQLLVKEGQAVVKGQRIAEMGNTDSDQVKLHFEIRRFGKPVDPLKLLPPERPS
jgi:lipoprotein NlpD